MNTLHGASGPSHFAFVYLGNFFHLFAQCHHVLEDVFCFFLSTETLFGSSELLMNGGRSLAGLLLNVLSAAAQASSSAFSLPTIPVCPSIQLTQMSLCVMLWS
jgi:hypothetical protein